jgi:hypothetical protein
MAKRTARVRNERPARQGGSRGSTVAPERESRRRPDDQNRPDDRPDEQKRPPFLNAQHIGNRGARLKLVPGTVRTLNGQFGQQVVVDVELNGSIYSWGISVNRPNLRLLVEHLVEDTKTKIPVRTLISQQNRPYIAVDALEQTDKGRGRVEHDDDDDIPF